jgi:hypothetical protein
MREPRRLLVALLALALASAAISFGLLPSIRRIGEARSAMLDYGRRIERLSTLPIDESGARAKLERVSGLVERAELRRSAAAAISLAAFGGEVSRLLDEQGIARGKYSVLPGKLGEQIELSLKCRAVELLRFLRRAAESEGWSVPYLSLRAGAEGETVEVVLRVGR